ncbi:hypothetical protein HDU84_008277 [Entophlyctis sp. JEL0112]|nr:hypothetical protein HDU84_008277 [Entophlyctis sp. JEL0112]
MRSSLIAALACTGHVCAAGSISADSELSGCYTASLAGTAVADPAMCGLSCTTFAAINFEFRCVCSEDLSEFLLVGDGCTFNCTADSSMTCGAEGDSTAFSVFFVQSVTAITSSPPEVVIPILTLPSPSVSSASFVGTTAIASVGSSFSSTSVFTSNTATATTITVVLAVLSGLAGLVICGWYLLRNSISCAMIRRKTKRKGQLYANEEEFADDCMSKLQHPSKVERFLGNSLSRGTPTKSIVVDDEVPPEIKQEDTETQGSVVTMGPTVAQLYEAVIE